jgi:hypothetical protein
MQSDTSRGTFADVIHNSPATMTAIAHQLRDLIAEVYPDVVEIPKPAEQHAEYAIGRGKANQVFGYICPMAQYVRLGFYYGGSLPDPEGLLVGSGKRLRHVKLYTAAEAERPAIRALIEVAVQERKTSGQ